MQELDPAFECRKEFIPQQQLNCGQIFTLIQRMLIECNRFYAGYTVKIAYLSYLFSKKLSPDRNINIRDAVLLGLFRNVGDYHFSIERPVDYDDMPPNLVRERYLYTYAWVKNMTPLSDIAQAYLFFNTRYDKKIASMNRFMEYGSLVFVAERIVKLLLSGGSVNSQKDLEFYGITNFNMEYVDFYRELDKDGSVTKMLVAGEPGDSNSVPPCAKELEKIYQTFECSKEQTNMFFKTLVSILDFKSSVTVWHTIHTAGYACSIGKFYGCNENELNALFTAGVLHDVGKIAVPQGILEYPGKLRKWEYRVIQTHVSKTEEMISDIVDPVIAKMAYRHHEKLNGTGYPHGLSEKDLSMIERIIQVADVLSALVDRRSYKDEMTEEQLFKILHDMVEKNELDPSITALVDNAYGVLKAHRDDYTNLLILPLGMVEIDFLEEMSL